MSRYAVAATASEDALHVGRWRGDDPAVVPVLAVHGVTAHHLEFAWLADALPTREVLAPDLRGRGRSREVPGPYGMATHADDVARVLDRLDRRTAVLLGHSMGAFVALVAAHRHPDRVAGLVLVDGGLPLSVPEGMAPEQVAEAMIGPSLRRLEARFADAEEHRDLWRRHASLGAEWGPRLEAYADADLHGSPPELASRTAREAVDADTRDLLLGAPVREALAALAAPTVLLLAAEGMAPGTPPIYDAATVERYRAAYPALRVGSVPATNHYTVLMSDHGAGAVADAVASVPGRHD